MNVSKTMRYLSAVGTAALSMGAPSVAFAVKGGYTPDTILKNATDEAGGGIQNDALTGDALNERVSAIAGWAIGIAVVLFVLRVVLTAVDRMVLGGEDAYGNQQSVLAGIPVVGAYPPKQNDGSGYTWKDIWINFAKQLAICAGAWFLVNMIVSLVGWLINSTMS